jgi:hypothetical protein
MSPGSPRKTYAISQFLAEIILVPIYRRMCQYCRFFFEISIGNHFVGVMNGVIFEIEFPRFTIFCFYLVAFGGVVNSTHFRD